MKSTLSVWQCCKIVMLPRMRRLLRRDGKRRYAGTPTTPVRWMYITKQLYKLSTLSPLRMLSSLMIIALITFVVVKFRDNTDRLQTADGVRSPAVSETDLNTPRRLFNRWLSKPRELCGGRLTVYSREFARLQGGVLVDTRRATSQRRGGETVDASMLGQPESDELYQLGPGFFQLHNCPMNTTTTALGTASFNRGSYLNEWIAATRLQTTQISPTDRYKTVDGFTVALTRSEYANVYHTMSDWYNVFIMTRFFNVTQPARVLLLDAHPAGPLDDAWTVIFKGGVSRLGDYDNDDAVVFTDLVWSIPGHRGPLEHHYSPRLPLADQFGRFVLSEFGVQWNRHRLNCSSLSILLISRQDYVTHVRNPTAVVRRKIANEPEVLTALRTRNPHFRIRFLQLERLTVRQQLRVVASNDMMVGMTGAGLTHAMFMPQRSGLVEIMTGKLGSSRHFQAIARWRRLEYETWTSQGVDDDSPQNNYTTYVPADIVDKLVKRIASRLCPQFFPNKT